MKQQKQNNARRDTQRQDF